MPRESKTGTYSENEYRKEVTRIMLKIDVFSHFITKEYCKRYLNLAPEVAKTIEISRPSMTDLEIRENLLSRHPDVLQIITMGNVPPERYVSVEDAIELSKIGNEEMAELVTKKPNLFYGAVGTLPIDDVDASLREIDHCINDLGLMGIQLFTTLQRESLTELKYRPIFARMAELDRPIWVHPAAIKQKGDCFTWPYESTVFMQNVVYAGIFEEFPRLKIIIHHAGGMVPHYYERARTTMPYHQSEYLKYFYTDTALYGNTPGLMSAFDYFGADHIMFGTDAPLGGPAIANGSTGRTINAIEKMDISAEDKEKIFHDNVIKLLVTPV